MITGIYFFQSEERQQQAMAFLRDLFGHFDQQFIDQVNLHRRALEVAGTESSKPKEKAIFECTPHLIDGLPEPFKTLSEGLLDRIGGQWTHDINSAVPQHQVTASKFVCGYTGLEFEFATADEMDGIDTTTEYGAAYTRLFTHFRRPSLIISHPDYSAIAEAMKVYPTLQSLLTSLKIGKPSSVGGGTVFRSATGIELKFVMGSEGKSLEDAVFDPVERVMNLVAS